MDRRIVALIESVARASADAVAAAALKAREAQARSDQIIAQLRVQIVALRANIATLTRANGALTRGDASDASLTRSGQAAAAAIRAAAHGEHEVQLAGARRDSARLRGQLRASQMRHAKLRGRLTVLEEKLRSAKDEAREAVRLKTEVVEQLTVQREATLALQAEVTGLRAAGARVCAERASPLGSRLPPGRFPEHKFDVTYVEEKGGIEVLAVKRRGRGGGETTWMKLTRPRAAPPLSAAGNVARVPGSEVGARQISRRVNALEHAITLLGIGRAELRCLMRRRTLRPDFEEAAKCAKLLSSQVLPLEATLELYHSTSMSWSAGNRLRSILKKFNVHVKLASVKEMKAAIDKWDVPMYYYRTQLDAGKRGSVAALVATKSILDVLRRDLDDAAENDTWDEEWLQKRNSRGIVGHDVIEVKLQMDGGGGSISAGLQLVGTHESNSHLALSIFAQCEAFRKNGGKANEKGCYDPVESYENLRLLLALTPGWVDLDEHCVVALGKRHVVLDSLAVRDLTTLPIVKIVDAVALADFFSLADSLIAGRSGGSMAESAAAQRSSANGGALEPVTFAGSTDTHSSPATLRATTNPGSAVLIVFDGPDGDVRAAGVRTTMVTRDEGPPGDVLRAGDAARPSWHCFAFKDGCCGAPYDATAPPTVHPIAWIFSSDLKITCCLNGMGGQSGNSCLFCDASAAELKERRRGKCGRLPRRTIESQNKNLEAWHAAGKIGLQPHGVNAASLLSPGTTPIPPPLHISSGAGNAAAHGMRHAVHALDGGSEEFLNERDAAADDLTAVICEIADDTRLLLDNFVSTGAVEVERVNADRDAQLSCAELRARCAETERAAPFADALRATVAAVIVAKARFDAVYAISPTDDSFNPDTRNTVLLETAATLLAWDDKRVIIEAARCQKRANGKLALSRRKEDAQLHGARATFAEDVRNLLFQHGVVKGAYERLCEKTLPGCHGRDAFGHGVDSGKNGPMMRAFLEALRSIGVSLQRYWNGQLVGGHVMKLVANYEIVIRTLQDAIRAHHGPDIVMETSAGKRVADTTTLHVGVWSKHIMSFLTPATSGLLASTCSGLQRINSADRFAHVHGGHLRLLSTVLPLMMTTRYLDVQEMCDLETSIKEFVDWDRAYFPKKNGVTPKMHYMEDHVMDFVRKYGSLGQYSEQSIESLHADNNKWQRHVCMMRNPIKRHEAKMTKRAMARMAHDAFAAKRRADVRRSLRERLLEEGDNVDGEILRILSEEADVSASDSEE
jgi:hypothetical protein